jgi:hypothetical protein
MIKTNCSKVQNKLYYLNDVNIRGIKPEVQRDSLANQRQELERTEDSTTLILYRPLFNIIRSGQIRRNGRKVLFFSVD